MYLTDLGNLPIIDDLNASRLVTLGNDPLASIATGFELRDYGVNPLGSYAAQFSGTRIPRSDWDELIEMQDRNESSPWHVHKSNKLPILSQATLPYCWMYGTVAGVMNRYGAQGIEPVPHLSATGPAAQGKQWRKSGGWAGEAIKYIEQYGIPTVATWPDHAFDRSLANNREQQADAAKHKIVEFREIESRDFDMAVSALLSPFNPCPVTLGLAWWGHLVCGLRVVKIAPGKYGIVIVNSWTEKWGDRGYAVLTEEKAIAHEYVVIVKVLPRQESLNMAIAA